MAIFKYLREAWQSDKNAALWRQRMIDWRREPVTVRISKPMRLDRARSVGYKAKQGYVVVRQRVKRGGRMRERIRMGRRPKHYRHRKILKINYGQVAEQRANSKFPNLTVLNSYLLCRDAIHSWYEIILIDPNHPNIISDRSKKGAADKKGRAQRSLTRAGRKSRGLLGKGKGREKIRPSINANKGRGK